MEKEDAVEKIRLLREGYDRKLAEELPAMIEKVKAENPDVLNSDHIEEMARSLVILKIGIMPTSTREGPPCPQPESSTSPKPRRAGKKTLVTSILDALEKDCLLAGEIPSESGQTETGDKS